MAGKHINRELRFPFAGVERTLRVHISGGSKETYPTPWSANVWPQDQIAKRFRGGSRAGLTKFNAGDFGATISDMIPVQVGSASGTEELLVVLVDSAFAKVDSSGTKSTMSSGPASGFLVAGDQKVYAVASTGVTVLDPKTGSTASLSASAGSLPASCTLGAVYRGRLFLAGYDNAIYASKAGDFTNWSFGVDKSDTRRAKPFQLANANIIGGQCTALVPYEDAFMLAATARTLWVIKGSPGLQGKLQQVSPHVGIVSSHAWCNTHSSVVFLAEDGVYQVQADGGKLSSIGRDHIPDELLDVDTSTTTVSMGYDHDARGVHIYLVTSGTDVHWFLDLQTQTFWPMELQAAHEPKAVCRYGGDLLLAGSDGYVRSVGGANDDGTAIESHVLVGPIRLGSSGGAGYLRELAGDIAAGSGAVNWRVILSDTAEGAAADGKAAIEAFQAGSSYSSYVSYDGSWAAGWNRPVFPRRQAVWACVWLQSVAKWGYESMTLGTVAHKRWN